MNTASASTTSGEYARNLLYEWNEECRRRALHGRSPLEVPVLLAEASSLSVTITDGVLQDMINNGGGGN